MDRRESAGVHRLEDVCSDGVSAALPPEVLRLPVEVPPDHPWVALIAARIGDLEHRLST
jgi:hypothetical protein